MKKTTRTTRSKYGGSVKRRKSRKIEMNKEETTEGEKTIEGKI